MTKEELNSYVMRVTQAKKTELIVIMYEVAIKYIEDGMAALDGQNVAEYRDSIKRAKSFVNELASVLDMKYPISGNLLSIYSYINSILVKADCHPDKELLSGVSGLLIKLKSAFEQVSKQDVSEPLMQNTQQVYAGLTYSRNSLNESYMNDSDIKRGYKV